MAGGRQTYFRLQNWRNSTVAGNLNFGLLTIRPPRPPTQQQKTAQVGYFLSRNRQTSYPQHWVSQRHQQGDSIGGLANMVREIVLPPYRACDHPLSERYPQGQQGRYIKQPGPGSCFVPAGQRFPSNRNTCTDLNNKPRFWKPL